MSLPHDVLEKYRRAGRIAAEVRGQMNRSVSEDMLVIDICEKAEGLIRKKGGKPAFPCNVSIDEVAAHYTSPPGDKKRVPSRSVVKVDIGVHVDGYIADTATTVCFNPEYEDLVTTAEEALRAGIKAIHAGLFTSSFGSIVQKSIESRGLRPVSNLTGHQVGRFMVHTGRSLPNVSHLSASRVNADDVFAIEPFVTLKNAAGKVGDNPETTIFRFVKQKSLKDEYAKKLCDYIVKNFHTLPFTERWIQDALPVGHYRAAFSELLSSRSVMAYPVYVEVSGKPVAQAEHTVLVKKDGCEVFTQT
jgi:methionyl aminopeptidase